MTGHPIALVTGAAQGIGLATAELLLAQGHFVVLADIRADAVTAEAARLGERALAMVCDMGDTAAIHAMFDAVEAHHGAVSVLVNNAGIALPRPFLETSVEEFRKVVEVNLVGMFVAIQRAAATMVARQIAGTIVNMSSINAVVAIPTIAAYCASKGGVGQLTKAAALALAPHGIRVNAVGPGSIDTEMMAGVNANPEAMRMAMSRTPLQRMGTAREVAETIAFLAGPKSAYITGETIFIDGGRLGLNYVC